MDSNQQRQQKQAPQATKFFHTNKADELGTPAPVPERGYYHSNVALSNTQTYSRFPVNYKLFQML